MNAAKGSRALAKDGLSLTGWSRRRFVQTTGLGAAMAVASSAQAATALEAYANATSVVQGGTLNFFVRDPGGSTATDTSASVTIVRLGGWVDLTLATGSLKVRNQVVPANASVNGCNWPLSYSLQVPAAWASGLYYAFFLGATGSGCCVPFVVRSAVKAASTKLLVQIPVSTAQAYNNYGGQSLSAQNSLGGIAAVKVSFDRPFADRWNTTFDAWQGHFVRWLNRKGIAADFCTSIDLHADVAATSGYAALLIAGHDEFWTHEVRDRFDAFVGAGGNAAIFGGNTCFWQARLESSASGVANRTLVCYKDSATDPDARLEYKTTAWAALAAPFPAETSIGLGSARRGVTTYLGSSPRLPNLYEVQTGHWVFNGTGLQAGNTYGGDVCGPTVDAAAFVFGGSDFLRGGLPASRFYVTGSAGSPETVTILSVANVTSWPQPSVFQPPDRYGMTSIHSKGGTAGAVFNAGTLDWAYGLQPELSGLAPTAVGIMTRNVIQRFTTAHKESTDVRRYRNELAGVPRYTLSIGNNPPPDGTLIDGVAFRAYPAALANTVPVYRYKYPQAMETGAMRYYLSLQNNIGNGWIPDGIAFHAFASPVPNSMPIYRHHFAQAGGDGWRFHFTSKINEPGWIFDDLAFYVPTI